MDAQTAPETAVTVNAILDRFEREYMPRELAPRTQRDYARHVAKLKAIFGERIASDLKPKDFGPFLQVQGRGRVQRVRQLAVLSAAFTQAVSYWFWIDHNVLRDVKRPKSKPRDRLILDHEFQAVRALASPRVQLAMDLALITGQRQGDLIALQWSDVRDMELHIYQAKTGKRLAIEITPDLERLLDRCWLLPHRGTHIISTRMGRGYTSEGFRACWQRTINKAMRRGAFKERFTFHDIRALCATRQPTPEAAMRLLGHTTLAMTMRVYRRGIERVRPLQL